MLLTAQPKAWVSAEMHQLVQPHMAGTTGVPGMGKDPEQRGLRDLCRAAVSTVKNAFQSLNACVPHTSALRPMVFHDGVIVGRHPSTHPTPSPTEHGLEEAAQAPWTSLSCAAKQG